uniref:Uncharacterized protein n=1 Tax=Ditylenchus dipsaci TaxID=166011 RepID=A0A915E0M2_9BILA
MPALKCHGGLQLVSPASQPPASTGSTEYNSLSVPVNPPVLIKSVSYCTSDAVSLGREAPSRARGWIFSNASFSLLVMYEAPLDPNRSICMAGNDVAAKDVAGVAGGSVPFSMLPFCM